MSKKENPLPQFKRFDRITAAPMFGNRAGRCITISRVGTFGVSKELAEAMQLRLGTGIAVLHDDTQDQWYLQRDDVHGIPLRQDGKGRMLFASSTTRKAITATLPDENEAGRIPVADPVKIAGITLWPLLTSGIRQQRRKKD